MVAICKDLQIRVPMIRMNWIRSDEHEGILQIVPKCGMSAWAILKCMCSTYKYRREPI